MLGFGRLRLASRRPSLSLFAGHDADDNVRALLSAGQHLIDCWELEAKKMLQVSWLKTMVRLGKVADLEGLDSTVVGLLDNAGGAFWRSVQALQQAAVQRAALATSADGEFKVDKNAAKELALHCVQIHAVKLGEMADLGFENVEEQQKQAREFLTKAATVLVDKMATCKTKFMETYSRYQDICGAIDDWSEEAIKNITRPRADETESDASAGMQLMLNGCCLRCADSHGPC